LKRIIAILLILLSSGRTFSQKALVLYTIEENENKKDIVAVPFVIYKQGKYQDPPICDIDSKTPSTYDKNECTKAKKILFPFVKKGQWLYLSEPGKKLKAIKVIKTIGYSGWMYSGKLKNKPNATILSSDSTIITRGIKKKIKTLPKLKETQFEGIVSEHILIGKLDIDGDGIAELIYKFVASESMPVYEIYSFKKNTWKKIYEGGRLGG
jgi:hypothetical protein